MVKKYLLKLKPVLIHLQEEGDQQEAEGLQEQALIFQPQMMTPQEKNAGNATTREMDFSVHLHRCM